MFADGVISDSEEETAIPLILVRRKDNPAPSVLPHEPPKPSPQAVTLPSPEPVHPEIEAIQQINEDIAEASQVKLPIETSIPSIPPSPIASLLREDGEIIQAENLEQLPLDQPVEPFKRSLRKRKVNQLRPYTYDTYKYGKINFNRPSSSPDFYEEEQKDSYSSTDYHLSAPESIEEYEEEVAKDAYDSPDPDPGPIELAHSPLPIVARPQNTNFRVIESSESEKESDVEIPPLPRHQRRSKFIIPDHQDELESHANTPSSESELDVLDDLDSETDTDSDGDSVMEAPIQLDFMMSKRIQDLPKRNTQSADFLRVAARTARKRQPKTSTGKQKVSPAPLRRKLIRHERQSRINMSKLSRGSNKEGAKQSISSIEGTKSSYVANSKVRERQQSVPTSGRNVSTSGEKATSKSKPKSTRMVQSRVKVSRKRKRKDIAERMLKPGIRVIYSENPRKKRRVAPQPRDLFFTPIFEAEVQSFIPPPELSHTNFEHWEVDAPAPSVYNNNVHSFWYPKPVIKSKLPNSTFVGSNTLTLLEVPESWNGESSHPPIIGYTDNTKIIESMDLHSAQLIDDSILESTYFAMYDFYFQLAAELLRPDTLVDTDTREMILKRSVVILDRILDQIDHPHITTSARLMFTIFTLCAGYSASQVGFIEDYDKIKPKAMKMVIKHLKELKHTLRVRPPYDRYFVAFELVLAMQKLGVWSQQLENFEGHPELRWQLVFIDACIHDFNGQAHNGWPNVQRLLLPQHLETINRLDYSNRCISLFHIWHWPRNRMISYKFFDYYTRYKSYADPHLIAKDIPNLVFGPFRGQIRSNEWHSFLELLGMSLKSYHGSPEMIEFRNSVLPTTVLSCPDNAVMDAQQLSSASQRLSIALVLFNACPPEARLPIDQTLSVVRMLNSHLAARVRLLYTWQGLAQVAEKDADIQACVSWISKLATHTFEQYESCVYKSNVREKIDGFVRFFEELYSTLLKMVNASHFYIADMIAPLNYRPSPRMKQLIWRVVQQMPIRTLEKSYNILERYFTVNSDGMDTWIQVLVRLNAMNLNWPHNSKPVFLATLMRRMKIPIERLTRPALEFLARPAWNNNEAEFFKNFQSVYKLHHTDKREELTDKILNSYDDAKYLLEELERNIVDHDLDRFEQLVYESSCYRIRYVCFKKYPQLRQKYQYSMRSEDEMKDSLLGFIQNGNWQGFQYCVSHKIIMGLKKNEFNTFIKELMPCLNYIDSNGNIPTGFEALVNKLFSNYISIAVRRPQMQKFIPLFARITFQATEFSDCLRYNPLRFLECMAAYITCVMAGRQAMSDWKVVSLFMRICCTCTRQLFILGGEADVGDCRQKWLDALPKFVQLAIALKELKAGSTQTILPKFKIESAPVLEDFLRVGKDPVTLWEDEMEVTRAINLFLQSYECLNSTQLLL